MTTIYGTGSAASTARVPSNLARDNDAAVANGTNDYRHTTGAVSDDCGSVSGRACGTRQADDVAKDEVAGRVAEIRHRIRTAADGEDEI